MSRTKRSCKRRMTLTATQWARKLWCSLDTPKALAMEILYRHGEFNQLVKMSCSPTDYADPLSFFKDYQAVKALSKYPYLETGIDTTREGRVKFLEAEIQCFYANERILGRNEPEGIPPSPVVNRVLYAAQQKIAAILGDVPTLEELDFKFGPGACFGTRGDTSAYKKLSSPLECTFAQSQICSDFLSEFPGWIPDGVHSVLQSQGSELSFVPKDAKTDRPICIEPLLNGLMQKGIGSYIRRRLSHHGVDLRNQEINQRLASLAEKEHLSTVDFSSASDTISYALVLDLLPIDWVEFLDVARSPQYLAEGVWYTFHKWASMGNAYTFELETAIFYSLAYACCSELRIPIRTQENIHVYGDDVIIPREAFDLFLEVTSYCGFSINTEKSYRDGSFFESCGADWFQGRNVRPVLIKKRISTLQDHYYVANRSLSIAARLVDLGASETDPSVQGLLGIHRYCVGCIPRARRFLVPMGAGDVGLWAAFDLAVPVRHESWEGYWYRSYVPDPPQVVPSSNDGVPEWPMSYALYWAGSGSPLSVMDCPSEVLHSDGYTPRPKSLRFRTRKTFWFGDWDNPPIHWGEDSFNLVRGRKADAPPSVGRLRELSPKNL